MKHFAICYDQLSSAFIEKQLMAFVSRFRYAYSWSKPFDGLILIKSENDKSEIAGALLDFFDEKVQFIVTEIGADETFAVFNSAIWDWLRQNNDPKSMLVQSS